MKVTVLFFGILKDIVGVREESVEIEPDTTVGSLFDRYSHRF
jgi:molybdopterin converting factor small subunit